MAANAEPALGAPEIAGTFVNPKGLTKRMTATVAGGQVAGAVGTLAADAIGGRKSKAPETPSFGRVGYLAVTAEEVALVKTKPAMLGLKMQVAEKVLARSPRTDVAAVTWDEGRLLSHLRISFLDGGEWQFDIPKAAKATARTVVQALQVN
jgi:hypothetical protein